MKAECPLPQWVEAKFLTSVSEGLYGGVTVTRVDEELFGASCSGDWEVVYDQMENGDLVFQIASKGFKNNPHFGHSITNPSSWEVLSQWVKAVHALSVTTTEEPAND